MKYRIEIIIGILLSSLQIACSQPASPPGNNFQTPLPSPRFTTVTASPSPSLIPSTQVSTPQATPSPVEQTPETTPTQTPVPAPQILEISPRQIPIEGQALIKGLGFTTTQQVSIGDLNIPFVITDDHTLQVTLPSGSRSGQITVKTANGSITSANNLYLLPSKLIGWWQGEGDGLDAIGSHTAKAQGAVSFIEGQSGGQAFRFNGKDSFLSIQPNPTLEPASLTVEGWVRRSTAPDGYIYQYIPKGGHDLGRGLSVDLFDKKFRCSKGDGAQSVDSLKGTTLVGSFIWYHVACVFDITPATSIIHLYVNGQEEGGLPIPSRSGIIYSDGSSNSPPGKGAFIGAGLNTTPPGGMTGFFEGRIDELRLYGKALSRSEIEGIYAQSATN